MAVTHETAVRNEIADLVASLVDAGAGDSTLKIYTSAFGALLATLTLPDPAFGAASSGTITANSISPANATGTGTAATFRIQDGDATTIISGTVGTSGTDIIITNTSINTGDPITVTSLTYSAPS